MKAVTTFALVVLCTLPLCAKTNSGKKGSTPISQELNLTEAQATKLTAAKESHRDEAKKARDEVKALKAQLNAELQKEAPDQAVINEIAKKIAQGTQKLTLIQAAHLQELRTILNEEQYQKLLQMMNKKSK